MDHALQKLKSKYWSRFTARKAYRQLLTSGHLLLLLMALTPTTIAGVKCLTASVCDSVCVYLCVWLSAR